MKYYFVILTFIRLIKCDLENLVVDGEKAWIKDFPHSAFLKARCLKDFNSYSVCGASIVNQRIILTAAHCVQDCSLEDRLSVSVGNSHKEKGTQSTVNNFYIHKNYDTFTVINDIALLALKTDLKLNNRIKRVAFMKYPPYFEKAQIAGWGIVKEIPPVIKTDHLYYIEKYVLKQEVCFKNGIKLHRGMLCAISNSYSSHSSRVVCLQKGDSQWTCGASIVNQRIILTAAHCVDDCSSRDTLSVSVGHKHMEKGTQSSVVMVYEHKNFTRTAGLNDIALLKLKSDLKLNFKVQRVAFMRKPPYHEKAQVAGWGAKTHSWPERTLNVLHYIDQYVWKTGKCKKMISQLTEGRMCASSRTKSYHCSGGDSGSALVVAGYIQIGLCSFKTHEQGKVQVVYTDTRFHYHWIKMTTKRIVCLNQ